MIDRGLMVTLNSDDPAYFGGYVADNYVAAAQALVLTRAEIVNLAKNSFQASFLAHDRKLALIAEVERYAAAAS